MLCRSSDRREKEAAILEQQRQRLLARLQKTDASLRKRPVQDAGKIERRIGRWLGHYPGAEKLLVVSIERDDKGRACGLQIEEKPGRVGWAELAHGAYLLRTNCTERDPAQLWRWYIQLTRAEECFRIRKSDLQVRPVFHQKAERVDAHILVCFLTLALWRTLEMWMKSKALGDCARQLLKEVATVHSMDVVLKARPTAQSEAQELRLRVVARPDKMVAELLARLGLELPLAPNSLQNVVPQNGV